jgi:hypothetical protein
MISKLSVFKPSIFNRRSTAGPTADAETRQFSIETSLTVERLPISFVKERPQFANSQSLQAIEEIVSAPFAVDETVEYSILKLGHGEKS